MLCQVGDGAGDLDLDLPQALDQPESLRDDECLVPDRPGRLAGVGSIGVRAQEALVPRTPGCDRFVALAFIANELLVDVAQPPGKANSATGMPSISLLAPRGRRASPAKSDFLHAQQP